MHGMINCALQGFLISTYGSGIWTEVRDQAGLPADGFEAMLRYDDAQTIHCVEAACQVLHKHPNAFLEDVGTWLVTNQRMEPLRRLLRFAGPTFLDFLHSLEELGDRGQLAMPELDLPDLTLHRLDPSSYRLSVRWGLLGAAPVFLGCLRAMADDYGALAFLHLDGIEDGAEWVHIQLLDSAFAEGRSFALGGAAS